MKSIRHLLITLSCLFCSTLSHAQSIHPDLNVPKLDVSRFDESVSQVRDFLDSVNFNTRGNIDELGVSVPDYKPAFEVFKASAKSALSAYENNMIAIKEVAIKGQSELQKLQSDYSSRLYALEKAKEVYVESRETFSKAYYLEKSRMVTDLDDRYQELIRQISKQYRSTLQAIYRDNPMASIHDPREYSKKLQAVWFKALLVWFVPTPIPLIFTPHMFNREGDPSFALGIFDHEGVWGRYSSQRNRLLETRNASTRFVSQQAMVLFQNCRTATCVFALSKDYQTLFKELVKLNEPLQVGSTRVETEVTTAKYRTIRKLLKRATDIAATSQATVADFKPKP